MEISGRVEGLAQTAKCLAQTHTFAGGGSPSPTICNQSKRSPSHPGGARRQLPPSVVPDNSILLHACCVPDAVMKHTVLEVRGHRSSLAEALVTWVK